jgi:hypothetical protein
LTECGDLSEVEVEETEMVAVAVKTAEAIEMAAMTVKVVVMLKTATMAEATEMAAAVITMAENAAVDVTDGKGGGRRHIGGNTGS